MDLTGGQLGDKELAGQSHSHHSDQWLDVQVVISDEWRPQGSGLGPGLFNIVINVTDSGIEAPSASFLTTPSCVVR